MKLSPIISMKVLVESSPLIWFFIGVSLKISELRSFCFTFITKLGVSFYRCFAFKIKLPFGTDEVLARRRAASFVDTHSIKEAF